MKICIYCDTKSKDDIVDCPACGSYKFKYLCDTCGCIKEYDKCPTCNKQNKSTDYAINSVEQQRGAEERKEAEKQRIEKEERQAKLEILQHKMNAYQRMKIGVPINIICWSVISGSLFVLEQIFFGIIVFIIPFWVVKNFIIYKKELKELKKELDK